MNLIAIESAILSGLSVASLAFGLHSCDVALIKASALDHETKAVNAVSKSCENVRLASERILNDQKSRADVIAGNYARLLHKPRGCVYKASTNTTSNGSTSVLVSGVDGHSTESFYELGRSADDTANTLKTCLEYSTALEEACK